MDIGRKLRGSEKNVGRALGRHWKEVERKLEECWEDVGMKLEEGATSDMGASPTHSSSGGAPDARSDAQTRPSSDSFIGSLEATLRSFPFP